MNSTPGHGLPSRVSKMGVEFGELQMSASNKPVFLCAIFAIAATSALAAQGRPVVPRSRPMPQPAQASIASAPTPPPTTPSVAAASTAPAGVAEQLPANPPHVTMSNGLLSITAENSTLGDVLNGIKGITGASVDAPSSANSERVVLKLGPGTPQEVIQQLFAGSKFDYIILGSPENASSVQKIILTPRTAGGVSSASNNPGNQLFNNGRPSYQPPPPPPDVSADNAVDDEVVQPEPQEQEEVTPPVAGAEQGQIGPNGQANQDNQQQQQQGPKTPEQLLQELQKMQQQQQQQQNGNNEQQPTEPGRPQRGNVPQ